MYWLGQSVEVGRTLAYREERTQGGGGGGQGQSSGNHGGGTLKRPADKVKGKPGEGARRIHTRAGAKAVVEHLVAVGEEHKGRLDEGEGDYWMA